MGSPRYCLAAVSADILARRRTVTFYDDDDDDGDDVGDEVEKAIEYVDCDDCDAGSVSLIN